LSHKKGRLLVKKEGKGGVAGGKEGNHVV
jgi:hypothetical protein